ncbi:hypothetical protein RW1_031_00750 [Rhodococcus wratislaviensis NBRC 100605]|uniref:Uncharacterized protein n=1 Tax=Rhodococcus wratislaviensis NBRC 100605 TaxID=1219028 RepID=X0Q718_RHOWR|nr:hypothetical protein RW1_031_00750 [Rhodococcus wratislaviensis NBRC 100605]
MGAGEHDEQVGQWGVGDDALLTGDDPVVAVAYGLGSQTGGGGAGAGFGEGEGGDDFAGGDELEPLLLLFVGAAVDQDLPAMPLLVPNIERSDGVVYPTSTASSASCTRFRPRPPYCCGMA